MVGLEAQPYVTVLLRAPLFSLRRGVLISVRNVFVRCATVLEVVIADDC